MGSEWRFVHSAREVAVGAGCAARAAEWARKEGRRRPALVLDPWFAGKPAALELADSLAASCGAAPIVHTVPPGEPDLGAVEATRAALAEAEPDLIVVLGGGSAMDAAKVARMLLGNPGPPQAI